jgi:hypothetical protein
MEQIHNRFPLLRYVCFLDREYLHKNIEVFPPDTWDRQSASRMNVTHYEERDAKKDSAAKRECT